MDGLMRTVHAAVPCVLAVVLAASGCSRHEATPRPDGVPGRQAKTVPATQAVATAAEPARLADVVSPPAPAGSSGPVPVPEPHSLASDRLNAALLGAVEQLADHNYDGAQAELAAAERVQSTETERQDIARIGGVLELQRSGERAVAAIQAVLNDGHAAEAARLATAALDLFGGGDLAPQCANLKRQADALLTGDLDPESRRARFRQEGEVALRDHNLRAAALAFEEMLQDGDDRPTCARLEDVSQTLARYDACRARAHGLRRDPVTLKEAIKALREAARAWDTPAIRQEVDLNLLALAGRRDRVAIPDFEVRAGEGQCQIGRVAAEHLASGLRSRFEIADCGRLRRLMAERRTGAEGPARGAECQQEISRLLRARYLVLGRIVVSSGVLADARLVNIRSGLVVQTAQVAAASEAELIDRLPSLARLLMMSDDEKLAYENQVAAAAAAPGVAACDQAITPLASLAPGQDCPPPPRTHTWHPPLVGDLAPADLACLRGSQATAAARGTSTRCKGRLFGIAMELGDNCFLQGEWSAARQHFALARSLRPDRREVTLRLQRCERELSAMMCAGAAPAGVVARPRVAVLNFVVLVPPALAPPGFDSWAAEQVASYLGPGCDVVDRGTVFWYMGRLGLSMRDVVTDAPARRWLAKAINAQFFLFGLVEPSTPLKLTTCLIDAESGTELVRGAIQVQDRQEFKLRAAELAWQTMPPGAALAGRPVDCRQSETQVAAARRLMQAGQYAQAQQVCRDTLRTSPGNIALRAIAEDAHREEERASVVAMLHNSPALHGAESAVQIRQAAELVRQAEATPAQIAPCDRAAQQAARRRLHETLLARARRATECGAPRQAVSLLQSAAALQPDVPTRRALAESLACLEAQSRQQATSAVPCPRGLTRQPAAALVAATADEDPQGRLKSIQSQHPRRDPRPGQYPAPRATEAPSHHALKSPKGLPPAVAQAAHRAMEPGQPQSEVHSTRIPALPSHPGAATARAGETGVSAAGERVASHSNGPPANSAHALGVNGQASRISPADESVQRQAEMRGLVEAARKCLAEQDYSAAVRYLRKAEQLDPQNPTFVAALHDAEPILHPPPSAAPAPTPGKAAVRQKVLGPGGAAPAAKQRAGSKVSESNAQAIQPGDTGAGRTLDPDRRGEDSPKPPTTAALAAALPAQPAGGDGQFRQQLRVGLDLEARFRYPEAIAAYREALRLVPGDPTATAHLRAAEYGEHLIQGYEALAAKRFSDAVREAEAALQLFPGSAGAADLLKRARERHS